MLELKVEIAETEQEQEKGLMFRKSLDENSGMVFKFSSPKILKFWNLNTYIPLDIAFISPENKIVKITNIEPISSSSSIKTVSSDTDCLMAIETNIDFFSENDIKIGDKITLEENDAGQVVASFKKKLKEVKGN